MCLLKNDAQSNLVNVSTPVLADKQELPSSPDFMSCGELVLHDSNFESSLKIAETFNILVTHTSLTTKIMEFDFFLKSPSTPKNREKNVV